MPGVTDFYSANRGGGLYSEGVSQRLGAVIAAGAARLGLRPTTLTLGNLALNWLVAAALIADAERLTWGWGLFALVGWQVAYALDCADGQLARVTGQASPAGGRVDVLCDVGSQIALLSALCVAAEPPVWLAAAFTGTWLVNLITSVLATSDRTGSLLASQDLKIKILKLVRDYGAVILTAGLFLVLAPAKLTWLLIGLTLVNGAFLLASIVSAARLAYRHRPLDGRAQPAEPCSAPTGTPPDSGDGQLRPSPAQT